MIIKGYDIACCWCKPFVNLELADGSQVPHNPSTQQKQLLWCTYQTSLGNTARKWYFVY